MNNNEIKELADNLWTYLEPKVKAVTSSCIRFYRAQVTSAPQNGRVTVQKPFDTTYLSLPYISTMEDVEVGSQVVVFVFGSRNSDQNNSVVVGNGSFTDMSGTGGGGGTGGDITTYNIVLSANGWNNLEQSVTITGLAATQTVTAGPSDLNSTNACSQFKVKLVSQNGSTLNFACDEQPNVNINMTVLAIS